MTVRYLTNEQPQRYVTDLSYAQMLRVRQKTGRPRLTVVHVGANDGTWLRRFMDRVTNVHAYAIEPNRRALKLIRKNRSRRSDCELEVVNAAASVNGELLTLYGTQLDDGSPDKGASVYEPAVQSPTYADRVKTVDLNELCEQRRVSRIDYLRVNCEGYEHALFNGKSGYNAFLAFTNVAAIAVHGKSAEFLTPGMLLKKVMVTKCFFDYGFELIAGWPYVHEEQTRVGHTWQVWTRKDPL